MMLLSIARFTILAAALVAPGQKTQIRWCPDFDQAFVEARERNVPVLVAFIQDGEAQNEEIVTQCYHDRDFVAVTRLTVNLIASQGTSDRHGVVEVKGPDGRVRKTCKKYGLITCIEHQKIEQKAFPELSTNGLIDTPHHVLLTPDGEVIDRLDDYFPCDRVIALIRTARARVGPGLDADSYEMVRECLVAGEAAFTEGRYGEALEHFNRGSDIKAVAPIAERIRGRRDDVIAKGRQMLEESAQCTREKKYVEALSLLATVQTEFRKVRELSRQAKKEKDILHANPEAKEARRILELEPKAKKMLKQAFDALRSDNYAGAASLLASVVEKYEGTSSAKIATAKLDELQSDPTLGRKIRESVMRKECSQWLNLARNYRKSGLTDKVREYCEKVLEKYPDSEYSREARKLLDELEEDILLAAR